jgi:biopolymer transport protein ExbD
MQAAIEVASSRSSAAKGQAAVNENVRVDIDDKGKLTVNGQPVGWQSLGVTIAGALRKSKDKLVSLNASPNVKVGQVVEILDVSKQNGAARLALLNP